MEELGAIPLPSHSLMAPLVEDMLHDARTGLTVAVVAGPGRAVVFYGRLLMGRAWPQMRLEMPHSYSQELVHGWENQPTSLQTQWQFKRVKGPLLKPYWIIKLRWGDQDIPEWICQPNNPSGLIPLEVHLRKMHLEIAVLNTHHQTHWPSSSQEHNRHRREQRLSSFHLPQTMGLRVTGVHYWQHPWCHPDQTSQMGQDVPDMVEDIEKKTTWR